MPVLVSPVISNPITPATSPQIKPKTKDSKEAAEEMLRKFFNKG